jgi:hypothetical protein
MNNKYLLTKFKFILDDTSNFPPLVLIQEVSRTYFVSRYFIGRKDFRNFFSLFFAMHGQSISYHPTFNKHIYWTNNLLLYKPVNNLDLIAVLSKKIILRFRFTWRHLTNLQNINTNHLKNISISSQSSHYYFFLSKCILLVRATISY